MGGNPDPYRERKNKEFPKLECRVWGLGLKFRGSACIELVEDVSV